VTSPTPDAVAIIRTLGLRPASAAEPVAGGMDTAVWRFKTADGEWHALRLFQSHQRVRARREQDAMEAARDAGFPVPAVEATGVWEGCPAMVMQWVEGEPLLHLFRKKPWKMWPLSRGLGKLQAELHRLRPPRAMNEGAPDYWLNRAGEANVDIVAALKPLARTDTLVHMDFHPMNVLSDGSRFTGVIDWAGAAAGDPRADVAFTAAILQVAPSPPGLMRPVERSMRQLAHKAWRAGYEQEAGKLHDDELAPFLAWAGSVILHEMEPRAREGRKWPSMSDLEPIREWAARWRSRAGL
jgi:aminoglycoside phosphotransferase (APT) family kinase protein